MVFKPILLLLAVLTVVNAISIQIGGCNNNYNCKDGSHCVAPNITLSDAILVRLKRCKTIQCTTDANCITANCRQSDDYPKCKTNGKCGCFGMNCTTNDECSGRFCVEGKKSVCILRTDVSGQTCNCIANHLQNCKENSDCPSCTNSAFEPVCAKEEDEFGPAYTCRCLEKGRCVTSADCPNNCGFFKFPCCDQRITPQHQTAHCVCLDQTIWSHEEQCNRLNTGSNLFRR